MFVTGIHFNIDFESVQQLACVAGGSVPNASAKSRVGREKNGEEYGLLVLLNFAARENSLAARTHSQYNRRIVEWCHSTKLSTRAFKFTIDSIPIQLL